MRGDDAAFDLTVFLERSLSCYGVYSLSNFTAHSGHERGGLLIGCMDFEDRLMPSRQNDPCPSEEFLHFRDRVESRTGEELTWGFVVLLTSRSFVGVESHRRQRLRISPLRNKIFQMH